MHPVRVDCAARNVPNIGEVVQMLRTSRISYGGTAAVVTSMALISGLSAADATRPVIVSALLIAALADNLTDALSIHMFQESERLPKQDALRGTVSNFVTRLLLSITFVALVGFFPLAHVARIATAWGMLLLGTLTYLVARERKTKPWLEVVKHLFFASAVIIVSGSIGHWIGALLS
jgi:VIT1/CCC1 family predicted Fe2+/Mn2+ transporter